MAWTVVRVRGTIHARHDIVDTLRFLHLTRANHATVVAERPEMRGMLHRVQGYVTWGETDPAVLSLLLTQRGVRESGQPLSASVEGGPDVATVAARVAMSGLPGTPGVRPLFRLKAPKGGWRSTKKPYSLGGALGYRGKAINELVQRMV